MDNRFEVAVGSGTLRSASGAAVSFPHRWTPDGVTAEADFTGGHLLHLAAAGCVLNDVYREAAALPAMPCVTLSHAAIPPLPARFGNGRSAWRRHARGGSLPCPSR